MTLQQCRYIVGIAKHSSISKAANALFVTQPSISKAVRELENELGITILDRKNKGVLFTKEGEEFLFYARMLIENSDAATYHFKKKTDEKFKKLSISSQHYSFAIEAVANLINYLPTARYELTLHEGKTTDVLDEVHTNKSIIGIISISNQNKKYFEREFISNSLSFTILQTTKQRVFLRREHPLAHLSSINLEQLIQYPYLTYRKDDIALYFSEEYININLINKIIYLKDRGAMNNILSNTDGYNVGTGCIVKDYMNPNIISIPLEHGSTIEIGYIKRHDIVFSKEIFVFIDFLDQALSNSLRTADRK